MAEQTKKSVMALVRETTEATPVSPTAGTQYIALQDGFDIEPAFEQLENAELTGSIGVAKTIQGFEAPTASISHYIRHSGVEGQEPGFGLLMEAAFGSKAVASTQYDTVASSTVSVVKVDTGEGANFQRGQALLVKDGTNGYSIRPVLSVSGDNLTLGFQLNDAPAAGVNLGKAVLYKPGESHPTFSTWGYRANGGAIELIAGTRVTEFGMEANAGELINGSFSMEGVSFYFNPIEITSSTNKLDFTDDDGTWAATIPAGMYKDPVELAAAVQTAMDAATTETPTVTYSSSTGKFTIRSSGTLLSLLWSSGANTANTIGAKLGFSTAADDTGTAAGTGYSSDNAQTLSAPQTPSFDSSNPLVAKNNQVLLGDSSDADPACFSTQSLSFTLTDSKTDILALCAESGKSGSIITQREAEVSLVANLTKYDVEQFKRFRTNQQISFCYNFGTKTGGNWDAGKCGMLYMPTATISSFKLSDTDGLVTLEMTIRAYVDSSLGEVYLNFV